MNEKSRRLRGLIRGDKILVMPDAYDPMSARLIEEAGFPVVQCSGFSMSIASAYASETNVSYSENLELTRKIVNAVDVPVMADGEDGFGNLTKVEQAVREFIAIGAAGMNIEDQRLHTDDDAVAVVSEEQMLRRLERALVTRAKSGNSDFVINARTDAMYAFEDERACIENAVRRSNLYLCVGADMAFVIGLRTLDQVKAVVAGIDGPVAVAAGLHYNLDAYSIGDLQEIGVARASLPTLPIAAAAEGIARVLTEARGEGRFDRLLAEGLICSAERIATLRGVG